jgi:hypothetical protein
MPHTSPNLSCYPHTPKPSQILLFLTITIWLYRLQLSSVLVFFYFAGSGKNFGVNLHHLVSELHTICLTEVLTNTIWGTTVSSHTVWLKTLNLALMGGTPQHILFISFFVCLFYFVFVFVFLCYFSVLFFRNKCA